MQKAFTHFLLLSFSFFGIWFSLSLIDYRGIFEIEEFTKENERKLGELILDAVGKSNKAITRTNVTRVTTEIKDRICESNGIADSTITIHIIAVDDVNAFALPGNNLVVFTGLIQYCRTPEELAGVIAHEIAHIEHQHVKEKMMKEVGLAMLISLSGGDSGGEIVRQTIKILSSTAFDRDQESEADQYGIRYMANAGIDPQHSANFLFRLSGEKNDISKHFQWLSTHPNSSDRAAHILTLRKQVSYTSRPIMDSVSWRSYQGTVKKNEGEKDLF